jgi:hypothetical protein
MNTEQLKMMLDAFAALGSAGKEAFIWWLALDKGLPVFGWMFAVVGLCIVAKMLVAWGRESARFNELREAAGHSCYSDPSFRKTIAKGMAALQKTQDA